MNSVKSLIRVARFSTISTRIARRNITVFWKGKNGEIVPTDAKAGETLLQVAHKNGIELEGKY